MQLNRFEKSIVSHPLRFWLQDKVEAPLLLRMFDTGIADVGHALEIGCGYGNGVNLIHQYFGARKVTAIDFDREMVTATTARYTNADWLTVQQADASRLPFANAEFDMVFNFAVFHHIPQWQQAVADVHRVLKSGGYFVIEDLYRNAICNPISRRLFEHPQENRFNHQELITCLQDKGFDIIKSHQIFNLAGLILAQKRT